MNRLDGRKPNELRPISVGRGYQKFAEGSCLIELGQTRVVCSASVEERVPPFLLESGSGWVTAEYGMLPRSTQERSQREAARGRQGGRTQEIQRLIGRSLRAVTDLSKLGPRTIVIDCDVIQADGGTRTAAITGAFVALVEALAHLRSKGIFQELPVRDLVAATSMGLLEDQALLDLTYEEDAKVRVDMNLIMTGQGQLVEIQGAGERSTFTEDELQTLLALGKGGIEALIQVQKSALKDLL